MLKKLEFPKGKKHPTHEETYCAKFEYGIPVGDNRYQHDDTVEIAGWGNTEAAAKEVLKTKLQSLITAIQNDIANL